MLRLQTNFEDFLPAFKNRLFLKSQESLHITPFFKYVVYQDREKDCIKAVKNSDAINS
jgi:hypothetical protein